MHSLGLDDGRTEDLRALPDQLLDLVADPLREVGRHRGWPVSLAEGYMALIPKPTWTAEHTAFGGPLHDLPPPLGGISLEEDILWEDA